MASKYHFSDVPLLKNMKFLKGLLFLIFGLVLFFFLAGVLRPSVSYGHKITVNKNIKEAWAVYQDVSKYNQWLDGFKSIKLMEGEKNAVGSKYKVVVNPGDGQPDFEMVETVESFKEFDHMALHFDSDVMIFDQITSFAESKGKTVIETKSKVTGKGIRMKSIFSLMELFTDSFQKQETKNIENLKRVIESNTTDYYSASNEGIILQ